MNTTILKGWAWNFFSEKNNFPIAFVENTFIFAANLLTIIKFQTKMKKVLSVLALASTFAFVACGPSAEEKAKADEKRIQDSIEAATAMQDSIDAAMQAAEEMVTDSTAADTTAAATEAAPAEAAH